MNAWVFRPLRRATNAAPRWIGGSFFEKKLRKKLSEKLRKKLSEKLCSLNYRDGVYSVIFKKCYGVFVNDLA